jgi:hypothetical protein
LSISFVINIFFIRRGALESYAGVITPWDDHFYILAGYDYISWPPPQEFWVSSNYGLNFSKKAAPWSGRWGAAAFYTTFDQAIYLLGYIPINLLIIRI